MSDELDEYEDGVEHDEAEAAKIDEERRCPTPIKSPTGRPNRTRHRSTRPDTSTREPEKVTVTWTWRRWRRPAPYSTTPENHARERAIDDPDGSDGEV